MNSAEQGGKCFHPIIKFVPLLITNHNTQKTTENAEISNYSSLVLLAVFYFSKETSHFQLRDNCLSSSKASFNRYPMFYSMLFTKCLQIELSNQRASAWVFPLRVSLASFNSGDTVTTILFESSIWPYTINFASQFTS